MTVRDGTRYTNLVIKYIPEEGIMNELLAQAYGTTANIEANTAGNLEEETEKTAEAALLEELEKIADVEGIDLNEFDDNDIVDIITEALGGETEKTASIEGEVEGEEQEKLAEADFLGRTMAHAFYDELTSIQQTDIQKTAEATGYDPEFVEAFEAASQDRAQEIITYLEGGQVKQSSAVTDDAALDTAITERAGELLDEAGYDVDAIAEALNEV
jgi:hypothetical protein